MVAKLAKRIKRQKLKIGKVRLELLNALRAEGRIVKREFEKTTATWEGAKPTFELAISLKSGKATVLVSPGGNLEGAQKWVWLDGGTKAHPIRAKNAPNLWYRKNFTPKTKVGSFTSSPGSIRPPWRKTKEVRHPGIKKRNWSVVVVKQRRKQFTRAMVKAASV